MADPEDARSEPSRSPRGDARKDSLEGHQPDSEVVRLRERWRFFASVIAASLGILAVGSFLFPSVRAWSHRYIVLPIVADILGLERMNLDGQVINVAFPAWIQVVFLVLGIGITLSGWATLVTRRALHRPWATRIRIDAPFLLATLPFIALGVILRALETAQLFPFAIAATVVMPTIFVTIAILILISLAFSLWVESGGAGGFPVRFMASTFVFFVARALVIEGGILTTRDLPWWGYVIPPVIAYGAFLGVTLGNRLVTHRRILFSLGLEQVAFVSMFLASWVAHGPWPGLEVSYMGNVASRDLDPADIARFHITFIPVFGFTFGMYTLGSFLHSYLRTAQPWARGINLTILFGQLLEAWTITVAVNAPFGLGRTFLRDPGGWAGLLLDTMGGWGYVVAKATFAIALVHLLDITYAERFQRRTELVALLKGTVMALGMIPGIRITLLLMFGF